MAARLRIRLTPRAKGPEGFTGVRDGVLQARVSAPPVDGQANVALCRLVAKALGVPRTSVSVIRGHAAREKVLAVEGATDEDVRSLLVSARATG